MNQLFRTSELTDNELTETFKHYVFAQTAFKWTGVISTKKFVEN